MRDIVIVTVVATLCAAFLERPAPPAPPPHLAAASIDAAPGDWRAPPGHAMKHG